MVKSFIRFTFKLGVVLVLALGVGTGILVLTSPEPHKSAFTHDEIAKINPVLIVDVRTLMDQSRYTESMQFMMDSLTSRGVLFQSSAGLVIMPAGGEYYLPVIIQSKGGQVKLSNELVGFMSGIRDSGYKVSCYVGEAQSAAMHVLVTMCDKVVAKRLATLMQHRTHCGDDCSTPATFMSDIELSRKEAQALGVKYDEWHNLARGPEDHVFNLLEIEKYKLVDEWMD